MRVRFSRLQSLVRKTSIRLRLSAVSNRFKVNFGVLTGGAAVLMAQPAKADGNNSSVVSRVVGGLAAVGLGLLGTYAYVKYSLENACNNLIATVSEEDKKRFYTEMTNLQSSGPPVEQRLKSMALIFYMITNDETKTNCKYNTESEWDALEAKCENDQQRLNVLRSRMIFAINDFNRDGLWTFTEFANLSILLARAGKGDVDAVTDFWLGVLDRDQDGLITKKEIVTWYSKCYDVGALQPTTTPERTFAELKKIKEGKDGKVLKVNTLSSIAECFMMFDDNVDAKLSRAEIVEMMTQLKKQHGGIPGFANMAGLMRTLSSGSSIR